MNFGFKCTWIKFIVPTNGFIMCCSMWLIFEWKDMGKNGQMWERNRVEWECSKVEQSGVTTFSIQACTSLVMGGMIGWGGGAGGFKGIFGISFLKVSINTLFM